MKIAYLVNQYPKVSHSFIRREIAGLEAAGHRVLRISVRRPAEGVVDEADLREQELTTVLLDRPGAIIGDVVVTKLTRPRAFLRALRQAMRMASREQGRWAYHLVYLMEACRLLRILRSEGVDHLHAHFGTNPADVAMLCRALGGPTFSFTVHGPEEFEGPGRLGLDEKIRAADAVVGVSEFGRALLRGIGGPGCADRVHVVHCGVDPTYLEHEETPVPDVPQLVCVGRLCAQKNQPLLLEALRLVLDGGIEARIVLAGDGEMRGEVETRIDELDLRDHVTVTGWLNGEEVRERLLAARGLVLSSTGEGLPVVIMESLALCRPIVSPSVAGIPELVTPDCGWLVPPNDAAALAEAMTRLLRTPAADLATMGRAGRARVIEAHSYRVEASRLADIFERLRSGGEAAR